MTARLAVPSLARYSMGIGGESFRHHQPAMTTARIIQIAINRHGIVMAQVEIVYKVSGVATEWMTLSTAKRLGYV